MKVVLPVVVLALVRALVEVIAAARSVQPWPSYDHAW